MIWKKTRFLAWAIAGLIFVLGLTNAPVSAQVPLIPSFSVPDFTQPPEDVVASACVRLDGRCLFRVAAQRSVLQDRVSGIEQRINDISRFYFQEENITLEAEVRQPQGQNEPDIYIQVGNQEPIRLMSVTSQDAELIGFEDLSVRAEVLAQQIIRDLNLAKQERQPQFILYRIAIAVGVVSALLLAILIIYYWKGQLRRSKREIIHLEESGNQPVSTQLHHQQQWNVREAQHRLLQFIEAAIWIAGSLFVLGLFPYTRPIQVFIIYSFQIPIRIALAFVITYILIRLSFVLIDRVTAALTSHSLITPQSDRRLQLRVSTVSGVAKGIVTLVIVAIGFLWTLSWIGINIGPLLAGAGIIGFAVSLASQNLIKDALNGFFIILEDQYAVGDVISVGDVGGLVENINLRITRIRDAEGRLITIPNSEVKIVANLSSHWSRADLAIPIAYHTDIDQALALIKDIALHMAQDVIWREQIIDLPQVLGVDNFGDRGLVVRVWIKTQPLKQWEVAREFRRRLKVAFDAAGIPLPLLQQEIWFNSSLSENLPLNGQRNPRSEDTNVL